MELRLCVWGGVEGRTVEEPSAMGRIIMVKHPWIPNSLRKQRGYLVLATANHFFQNYSTTSILFCFCLYLIRTHHSQLVT